jgi:hypothetical protein
VGDHEAAANGDEGAPDERDSPAPGASVIRTKFDPSVEKNKLSTSNVRRSFDRMASCARGKWLLDALDGRKVVCDLTYVATAEAIPGIGAKRPAGFCQEAPRGEHYNVYVVVGYKGEVSQYECPQGHKWIVPQALGVYARPLCPTCGRQSRPGFTNVPKIVDRPPVEIAKTIFHELLHAWFMTEFPTGTGHDVSVEPEVNAFGITTYSEQGYDSRFLAHIKAFAKEVQ